MMAYMLREHCVVLLNFNEKDLLKKIVIQYRYDIAMDSMGLLG